MPDLSRFVTAQAPVYEAVLRELRAGRKESHWMWFIFPQMAGLGRSEMARIYGIVSLEEAGQYLAHPVLGPRLRECTGLVLGVAGRPLEAILGSIDAMKFCSSMTLFALVAPGDPRFKGALDKFCGGKMDEATVQLIDAEGP